MAVSSTWGMPNMTFWERCKLAWTILLHGMTPMGSLPVPSDQLMEVNHPYWKAARDAVRKVDADGGLKTMRGDVKRKEAITWAHHYLRDRYGSTMPESEWTFNFLVEYIVGKRKGYL